MPHQGPGVSVDLGAFRAGGFARGQQAGQQLGLQRQQLGIQQQGLEQQQAAQLQKQGQDVIKRADERVKVVLEEAKQLRDAIEAGLLSPEQEQAAVASFGSLIEATQQEDALIEANFGRNPGNADKLRRFQTSVVISKAKLAGREAGQQAISEQQTLAAGGLTPGQLAVAGGPALPPAVRPNVQNFIRPASGDIVGIDLNAPGASQTVQDLLDEDFVEFTAQATGGREDLFGGQQPVEVKEFRQQETATRNVLSTTARLRDIMARGDFIGGLTGSIIQTIESVEGNIRQASKALGVEIEGNPFDVSKYDLTGFGAIASQSQAFRTNIIGLALQMASAAEKGGGKLSDDDVKRQLKRLAAGSGDPNQILAALNEVDRGVVTNLQNFGKSLRLTPEQFPTDLLERLEPTGITGGFTFEDQQRLDELRARR